MIRLPVISGGECVSALLKLGYRRSRRKGSHVRLECPRLNPVTVPLHDTLDRGTLRAILRTAKINPAEFNTLLTT